ncbi:MAG: fibro-slime domain-containing protein [Chitinivibrionales bacterium]
MNICRSKIIPFIILLLSAISLNAQNYTIHISHPWEENTDFRDHPPFIQSAEPGWYPGEPMTHERGTWYSYTFTSTPGDQAQGIRFSPSINGEVVDSINYPGDEGNDFILDMETLFGPEVPGDQTEVWLIPSSDMSEPPEILYTPPMSRVIHVFNPWPEAAPFIEYEGSDPEKMWVNQENYGWFTEYYTGDDVSEVQVRFVNSFTGEYLSEEGFTEGSHIDLSPYLQDNDTVWIYPDTNANGRIQVELSNPGLEGKAPFKYIRAYIRDQKADNDEFEMPEDGNNHTPGMVEETLGSNGKPVKGDEEFHSDGLESWFETDTFSDNSTNEICYDLKLTKTPSGYWEYNSDWEGGFFPIDDFDNPNNEMPEFEDEEDIPHNFHFTMEINASFQYKEGTGQTFAFSGDDDVWVFINNQLVIDLGGVHEALEDSVNLDEISGEVGLENDSIYDFSIFYCERRTVNSNFRVKSTINLRSDKDYFMDSTSISKGLRRYDINKLVIPGGLKCGFDPTNYSEPTPAVFYLSGPEITEEIKFSGGDTLNNGIYVSEDSTSLFLDSLNIEDLEPGHYNIRVEYVDNPSKNENITFIIDNDIEYTENIKAINPFKPGDEFPDEYQSHTDIPGGTVIQFLFTPDDESEPDDIAQKMADSLIDAKVRIYDCVGNLVASCNSIHDDDNQVDVSVALLDEMTPALLIFWSGKNSSGRDVGGGGYALLVSGSDINGETIFYRIIVGVQ